MSPRPDVKEERTQQIIEAALKVFSYQGFHRATMDEIAEEAGVSKGTLYLYFKGKDKIISSLLQWFFKREYSRMSQWVEDGHSAREIIEKSAQMVIDDLLSIRPFVPVLFEFLALSSRNQTVGKVVRESLHGYIERIKPVFEMGIQNGEFKDLDPGHLVMTFGAIIEGSILVWSYDMKNIDFAEMTRNSVKIFLDGITI